MQFYHIGVTVKDIASTGLIYQNAGHSMSDTVFNYQDVNVCILIKEGKPSVELVAVAVDKSSMIMIFNKTVS